MKVQMCVLLLALALVAHCSSDIATKVMADDGSVISPQDFCKTTLIPGRCHPKACNTNCKNQIDVNSVGTCTPDGCQCTYCMDPPRN
ncbi:hypothetical protein GUJ93_ZPchr0011g27425 [Zizania palustris]|uniref:Uncharacterized protein n=1 Tax=Zizania palustris TaxID=103762 RepID=A0A8J5WKH5_ZIZPA|nr:hypothetical protein GUJ93_ZPchr0011g27425 [Zizania palustris]